MGSPLKQQSCFLDKQEFKEPVARTACDSSAFCSAASAVVSFLLMFAAGLAFQLISSDPPSSLLKFERINWAELKGCSADIFNSSRYSAISRIRSLPGEDGSRCVSSWIEPQGDALELEYSVDPRHHHPLGMSISLEDQSGREFAFYQPEKPYEKGKWRLLRINIPPESKLEKFRVVLSNAHPLRARFSLRDKISFYRTAGFLKFAERIFSLPYIEALSLLIFSCAIVCSFLIYFSRFKGILPRFIYFFALACFVHFRLGLFFLIDEWNLLDRLYHLGLSSVFTAHNEHVIPVFTMLYYLEYQLFKGSYDYFVIVSLIIHSLNTLFLVHFVQKLIEKMSPETAAYWPSHLLGLVYALSGLHSEALQWTICQSILLSTAGLLLSLISAVKYQYSGNRRDLAVFLAAVLLAVLSFAGGFVVYIYIPAVLAALWLSGSAHPENLQEVKKRGFRVLQALACTLAVLASIYFLFRKGHGHGLDSFQTPKPADVLAYVFNGTQFGSIIRGLGIVPAYIPDKAGWYYPAFIGRFIELAPYTLGLGVCVNFSLLVFYVTRAGRRSFFLLWILAQLFITAPLLLTGIGRVSTYGVEHSYVIRYQYISMLGIVMLLLPLVIQIFKLCSSNRRRRLLSVLSISALCVHVAAQLYFSRNYYYQMQSGQLRRNYVQQLKYWNHINDRHPLELDSPFELRPSSQHYGLHPIVYWSSPGSPTAIHTPIHPDAVVAYVSD